MGTTIDAHYVSAVNPPLTHFNGDGRANNIVPDSLWEVKRSIVSPLLCVPHALIRMLRGHCSVQCCFATPTSINRTPFQGGGKHSCLQSLVAPGDTCSCFRARCQGTGKHRLLTSISARREPESKSSKLCSPFSCPCLFRRWQESFTARREWEE